MIGEVRLEGLAPAPPTGGLTPIPMLSIPFAASILTLAFAVHSMAATTFSNPDQPSMHCIGRFDFTLPGAFRPTGRQQRIYLVGVGAEHWEPGESAPQAWARKLGPGRSNASNAPSVLREFELAGVGPAAWLRPSKRSSDALKLLAMRAQPTPGYTLMLEADASVGREAVSERVVTEVAKSYSPGSAQGFCVGTGAFVIRPSKNERALGTFAGSDIEISVETETVATPDDGQNTTSELPPGSRLLAKEPRRLDGFEGMEVRVQVVEKDAASRLVYLWIFPGRPADGAAPRIRLSASSGLARQSELDRAWVELLTSWHARPLGVR